MRSQAAILAALIVSVPAFAADAPPAPRLVVAEVTHDFASVQPNDVLHYRFTFRNEGTAPLEIQGVEADCKCTATDYDKVIAPGAAGAVNVAVDTRTLLGPITGTVRVTTNDAAKPLVILTTSVNVVPKLLADPATARWTIVQKEKEGTIPATIWSPDGADFRVLRVVAPPYLRTSFRQASEEERRKQVNGSQWRVEATLASDAPVGPITGFYEVETDHPLQPRVRIPISGFVRPVVHVTPEQADFGSLTLETERKASFNFRNFATEKISVVTAVSTIAGTSVQVKPIEAGRNYALILQLPTTMRPGDFKGVLRIKTDSPKAPTVEVPISGTIAKPARAGAAKPVSSPPPAAAAN